MIQKHSGKATGGPAPGAIIKNTTFRVLFFSVNEIALWIKL